MFLAAFAAAAVLSAPAAQDPLTFDQTVTCAAMFFAQSKLSTEADEVEAFEAGMVQLIIRAEGMNSGLSQDQIIESAGGQADQILARLDGVADAAAKAEVVWNWGPGLDDCIESVLA